MIETGVHLYALKSEVVESRIDWTHDILQFGLLTVPLTPSRTTTRDTCDRSR